MPKAGDLSLRERKKAATRKALSTAALRLAREHGPQNVRIDDIAEAAGVSPRTYNNYFSSREQAIIVALAAERGLRAGAALRQRPAEEPLEAAVMETLVEQYAGRRQPDKEALGLITSAPALRSEFLSTIAAIEHPLAQAIGARMGGEGNDDLGPAVLAAALAAAARVAAERWLRPEPGRPFAEVLREALGWVTPALASAAR